LKGQRQVARSNTARKNDLYASKTGQVARKNAGQWQVRNNNSWKNTSNSKPASAKTLQRHKPTSMPAQRAQSRPQLNHQTMNHQTMNHQNMNRHAQARQRGGARGGGRGRR